ncbi:MAG: branched-chain amino acid ABC transporter permease [Thermotogae bacterium]|nr:MAG: branched-chain amino acid ABC transporter permease [Thermotogota bacterium]
MAETKTHGRHQFTLPLLAIVALILIFIFKPYAVIYGVQRGSLYALIAMPLALTLGIVGILNLAHGDFLTLGAYIAYWIFNSTGLDPLLSIFAVAPLLFVVGAGLYKITVSKVLRAPLLNQLLLTFGIAMILEEVINLIWTSRPRNVYVNYASASASIGGFRFGTYEFSYLLAAVGVLVLLRLFLKHTRLGKAAFAVGQNPKGAKIVGINVEMIYLLIFSISVGIVGIAAGLTLPRMSIFPLFGSPFTLKSFCLAAMAGLGNLTGILWSGLALGIGEALVQSIEGYSGWSDIVFFGVLIAVITIRSYRGSYV